MSTQSTTPQTQDKGEVVYKAAGQEIKLSFSIVRNFLTNGGGNVTDADIVLFSQICRFNELNPFLKEAYLIKYGDKPATMVVSKEALMKRAEASQFYDGIQAGIIVKRGEEIIELEGCFCLQTDILLGGWAKVYRTDKKYPFVSKVNLIEYDLNQSSWNSKKSTMIRKVAEVQALREAFPHQLGAMYTAEEQGVRTMDVVAEDVTRQPITQPESQPEPKKEHETKKYEL
jgi:phage recombination protein Bet